MEGEPSLSPSISTCRLVEEVRQALKARGAGGQGMDVKGAKALSERLAEAARNVEPPPAKAAVSKTGGSPPGSKP